jgi:hypothetical protein
MASRRDAKPIEGTRHDMDPFKTGKYGKFMNNDGNK